MMISVLASTLGLVLGLDPVLEVSTRSSGMGLRLVLRMAAPFFSREVKIMVVLGGMCRMVLDMVHLIVVLSRILTIISTVLWVMELVGGQSTMNLADVQRLTDISTVLAAMELNIVLGTMDHTTVLNPTGLAVVIAGIVARSGMDLTTALKPMGLTVVLSGMQAGIVVRSEIGRASCRERVF